MPEGHSPAAEWRRTSVQYPYAPKPAVGPVDLALREGERLLLLGPSGSGKSSLLALLTGLIPQTQPAAVEGEALVRGMPAASRTPAGWSPVIARYFQDADQTLCGMRVADEIGFALENRALPEREIAARVDEAMAATGLASALRQRRTTTLSGGERQLVALAAVLAQAAPILIVDEPTAHLSPLAAARLHETLLRPAPEQSVLIVDHRLDGLIEAVDRVAVLGPEGGIVAEGAPAPLFREHAALLDAIGVWRPLASRLDSALCEAGLAPDQPPADVAAILDHLASLPAASQGQAREALGAFVARHCLPRPTAPGAPQGEPLAALHAADCAPFMGPTVLRGASLAIRSGEIVGILGANGAGKSTLGHCLAGVLRLKSGTRTGPMGGVAFQNAESQFLAGSVEAEIALGLGHEDSARVAAQMARWGLGALKGRHPFELSQGEKRRLALAALTIGGRWPLLVLDEPMAGLDAAATETLMGLIAELACEGRAVALITHDLDLALRLCSRVVVLEGGGLIADGPARRILTDGALLARAGLAPPLVSPVLDWLDHAMRRLPA